MVSRPNALYLVPGMVYIGIRAYQILYGVDRNRKSQQQARAQRCQAGRGVSMSGDPQRRASCTPGGAKMANFFARSSSSAPTLAGALRPHRAESMGITSATTGTNGALMSPAKLALMHGSGAGRALQRSRMEHREDNDGSRARLLMRRQ